VFFALVCAAIKVRNKEGNAMKSLISSQPARLVVSGVLVLLLVGAIAVLALGGAAWASPAAGNTAPQGHSTVPKKETDLSIDKSGQLTSNGVVVWTVTVKNNGPIAAESVVVTDKYDPHLVVTQVTTTKGSCQRNDSKREIVCQLGNLAVGQTVTITIRTKLTPSDFSGTVVNHAKVDSKTRDTKPGSNNAQAKVNVPKQADLAITNTAKGAAGDSDDFVFTITVTNNGSSAAEDTRVTDELPQNFKLVYAKGKTSGVSCSGSRKVECKLGTLAANKSATIEIRVDVDPDSFRGSITNTAVTSSKTNDPKASNNKASATVKHTRDK
jgi:uncharacterized repeat protein (TIGR01451 family)